MVFSRVFSFFAAFITFINLGIMIYGIYLFHTLAMSNKKIAETLEKLVHKIDKNSN